MTRVVSVCVTVVAFSAFARPPDLLGYQGRLLKADGTAATGMVHVQFALFTTPAGGSPLWTETQLIGLSDGYYSTFLGQVDGGADLEAAVASGNAWLELTVESELLAPRQHIGSVAYALNAVNVQGGTVDATSISINGTTVINNNGKLTPSAGYTAGPGIDINTTSQTISVAFSGCAANQVLTWSGSAWGCTTPAAGLGAVSGTPPIDVANGSTAPVVSVRVGVDAGTVAAGDDPRFGQLAIPSGAMMPFAAAAAPGGWLLCNGQEVSRTTFAALFAAIGTSYGAGDGTTTFNVPDLRGRVPAGLDPGNSTGRLTAAAAGGVSAGALANAGGEQSHTLSGGEMPTHSHGVNDPGHAHGPSGPFGGFMGVYFSVTGSSFAGGPPGFNGDAMGATSTNGTNISLQNAGGSAAHNNAQPTVIVNYIIKT